MSRRLQWHGYLSEKGHWGSRYEGNPAARDALAKLMKPGKDQSAAPPTKLFRDQTKQFAPDAFRNRASADRRWEKKWFQLLVHDVKTDRSLWDEECQPSIAGRSHSWWNESNGSG